MATQKELKSLTEEGRRGHCAVATGDHHTDARLHEGHGEVNDLGAFLVYGERSDGHVGPIIENLREEEKEEEEEEEEKG